MLILSVDSASSGCSVALWRDGEVLALTEEKMERGQDSRLVPMIQDVLGQTGTSYEGLDRIAVTRGPGSFTGIRIGLATARGIGLAANKPVWGVDRFKLHRTQHAVGNLLVVLESRRLELYAKAYAENGGEGEALMLTPEQIQARMESEVNFMIAGDATDILKKRVAWSSFVPRTEPEVITAARLVALAELHDPAFHPSPLYIRAPDVTIQACAKAGT